MSDTWITLLIIGLARVMFAWNYAPAAVVAIAAGVALYVTGVLTLQETVHGSVTRS